MVLTACHALAVTICLQAQLSLKLCRSVVSLKNVSSPKCTTAAEAMEVLRQVACLTQPSLSKESRAQECHMFLLLLLIAEQTFGPSVLIICCVQGQHNRHVAGHGLNVRSSRSHTVFTLWVETIDAGMTVKTSAQKLC